MSAILHAVGSWWDPREWVAALDACGCCCVFRLWVVVLSLWSGIDMGSIGSSNGFMLIPRASARLDLERRRIAKAAVWVAPIFVSKASLEYRQSLDRQTPKSSRCDPQ